MKKLSDIIVRFFQRQPYTVVTTIDKNGCPHNSCKGIVDIEAEGKVYLLDLYKEKTYKNLMSNSHVSITAVDEHRFIGYSLRGKAKIVKTAKIRPTIIKAWENRITKRISQRVIRNIQGVKGHPSHPEALLPKPEYLIEVDVKEIVDLTPHNIR